MLFENLEELITEAKTLQTTSDIPMPVRLAAFDVELSLLKLSVEVLKFKS